MSKRSIILVTATVLVAGVLAAVLAGFILGRSRPSAAPCVKNLIELDAAKQQWAMEYDKTTNDVPTLEELRPYLKAMVVCPKGGTYAPGRVGEPPRCSIGGPLHTMPQ